MFENHVLDLLRKYLGEYVHGLSAEALQISVWKGDVVLKDLQLKAEALNSLNLPIRVKAGFLGSVTLKVPWKRLGKEPVVVLVDRVFVLAEPAEDDSSFTKQDKERLFEAKCRQIEETELAMLAAKDKKKGKVESSPETNSWIGSLIATIVGNLKISISNVHVRYEDQMSNPGHPFCSGVTLAKLAAVTTDENGVETFDTSGAMDRLCKALQLQRFAVYHDSDCFAWKIQKGWGELTAHEWSEIFEAGIHESECENGHPLSKSAVGRQFLLYPVNGMLQYYRRGKKEKRDPTVPSQKISLIVNDVSLTISEAQYCDGMKFLEGISRYRTRIEVSHLRPFVSVTEDSKAWWRYSCQASLHLQNKTWHRLSWENVSRLCHLRRKYVDLYASFLQQEPRGGNIKIREIEEELDAKVILLWRLLAHARVESARSKETALEQERAKKSNWWSFGWGSSTIESKPSITSEESQGASDMPQGASDMPGPGRLTKEEWNKLNELLSYDPSDKFSVLSDKDDKEPHDMVKVSLDATIGQSAARIMNNQKLEIICGKFENLQVSLQIYPKSVHCNLKLRFYGLSAPEGSIIQSVSSKEKEHALAATFVHSPIGEAIDWKLSATMAPCHVTVWMASFDRCLQFLKRSNSVSPEVALETATALQMKLEKVTRRAQEQIHLVLEEQSRFSLDIDLDAPKVRLPFESLECPGSCSQLLIDFGHFTLCTENYNELKKGSLYSRFYISGRDTSAFFMDGLFDWANFIDAQTDSETRPANVASKVFPILDKCGMSVVIDQIKLQHPRYPSTRISIQIPNLGLHFSPARYSRIMNLLAIFDESSVSKHGVGGTDHTIGLTSWHTADLAGDARVLFWGGIGNSVAEWQPCWLVLAGSYLYIFESRTSQTYQRSCSMSARYVAEIPSTSVGGSEFAVAISNRGFDLQKALESSSTVVLQFRDSNAKSEWMKYLVQATYKASAPPSMCVPGDPSSDDSEDELSQQAALSEKAKMSVIGSLTELKFLVYGKGEEENGSLAEEKMLLELFADGGKVNLIQRENDLTLGMKLHSLKIEDKLQGHVSSTCKYVARSMLKNSSQNILEEAVERRSPESATKMLDEDEYFKDALSEFSGPYDIPTVMGSNLSSLSGTPRETCDFETPMTNSKYDSYNGSLTLGEDKGEEKDSSDFISVTFVTKQPDSPRYDGTDTQMNICMTKLEFFCNRSTVVALIDFGMDLSELMEHMYDKVSAEKDIGGIAVVTSENIEGIDRLLVKGLLGNGKSRVVFQLKMNVDSVCIFLNKEDGSQLAMLVQEKFQMDLKVHPSSISIEGMLGNLKICDMSLGPDHWWGWLCDIRDPGSDSLVKLKFQSFCRDEDDFQGYDYSLSGRLSAVRLVFLYRFIQEITAYFMGLATPQAQQAIRVVDKVRGIDLFIQQSEMDGLSAVKLDVSLDTPIIIMPHNSMSKNFMQLDLGHLQLSNNFEWHGGRENDPSAVHLDVIHAEISGINMVVGVDGQPGKSMIKEARGLCIKVCRSLRDVFRKVPEVAVDIQVDLLHGVMSDKEYMVIIDCASSNMSEEANLPPNVREIPERKSIPVQVEKNTEKGELRQMFLPHEDQHTSNQDGLCYTCLLVTVEIQNAHMELYNGIERESPLARMDLLGLWVAYRTTSISELDLCVSLPKLSVVDLRPSTKPEMRLMLGSMADVERNGLHNESGGSTETDIPKLTMLVMDWRVKTDSQSLVVRMQQPRLLVVLDFLLAVGEYFVPSLGAITGREEAMYAQNDPVTLHDHIRLNSSLYKQKEDILFLSPDRQLIADAYDVNEFTYDGCGKTICLIQNDDFKGNSCLRHCHSIIVGYGKTLRFKNVRFQNVLRLGDFIYLSSDSSYCASVEDGVVFDGSNKDNQKESYSGHGDIKDDSQSSSPVSEKNVNDFNETNNYIIEIQAVAPELTFYDSTKWSLENSLTGEKMLRAKMDFSLMYAAKENDRWVRGLIKGLSVESGSGLAVLDPVDISGEYYCIQDKTSVSVITTDIYIHLSFSVLSLLLRLQDDAVAALQFGSANALTFCTHFDRIWVDEKGNHSNQHIAIWRPRAPSNCVILGDCITSGSVPPSQAVMAVSNTYGRVKKPLGFELVWSFSDMAALGTELQDLDRDLECSIWMPISPTGYSALGCVAQVGKQPPLNSIVHCIRSDLVTSTMFTDCIYYVPPDFRNQNGFSIWRLENAAGSFLAHTSVLPPPKSVVCDLREVLRRNLNDLNLQSKSSDSEISMESNVGGNHGLDRRISTSRSDGTAPLSRLGRYYISNPNFERVWWDKGNETRRAVSIWRPIPPPGYVSIGDSIVEGLDPPGVGIVVRDDDSGRFVKPSSFKAIQISGKGVDDVFVWCPTAPLGYVALGYIASRSSTSPPVDSLRCLRMDLVNQANMSKKAVWSMSGSKGSGCSLWRVENQASTFIAQSDVKRPSHLAYGLAGAGKPKMRENFNADVKIGCLSMTVLDNPCGMMTPLVDNTLTNINLAAHGRLEALNVVLVSSVAASTFNPQLEAWEPLIEPFDGIFKYEAYDAQSDLPLRVGKRVRITATNVVNLNITSANMEMLIGSILSWRKQVEHEKQAQIAKEGNDYTESLLSLKASALEEDDNEKVVMENQLGCDLYFRQYTSNFEDIELLKADRSALVHLPPPKFTDRLNAVTEAIVSRHYVAVNILEARELPLTDDGNADNFFCALRLVTIKETSEEQNPFPQSARSRCVRPTITKTSNYLAGSVNWNEVFIFEVPQQGSTSLEVVVTNLAAKAGKGEAVGMLAIPMKVDTNFSHLQPSLPKIMQKSSGGSVCTFGLQPLKRKGPNNQEEISNCGLISLNTFYFTGKADKGLIGESGNKFSNAEVGLWIGLSAEGPWTSVRSVLPLSTIPKELNGTFGFEVVMKQGQKHAILRSLVTIVNDTDITLQVCVCPPSLLNSPDVKQNSDTRPSVITEEIFENQRYHPLSGWGNKWPGFGISTDPGHWSTNDYSYSSKDFVEPPLPPGWIWTSNWVVDKSHFVDSDGWAYGSDFQSLKWPLTSTKTCKRSAFDFVRRRRWFRVRQQLPGSKPRHTREVIAVLKPGCTTSLPWRYTARDTDFCVQVRPYSLSSQISYLWGRVISTKNSTDTSGSDQNNPEKSQSFSGNPVRQMRSGAAVSLFIANQLEKTEEVLVCLPESDSKQYVWLSMETDANILHPQLNSPVYDWRISVKAPLKLENKLPCNAKYIILEKTNEGGRTKRQHGLVSSGTFVYIYSVDIRKPIYLTWLAQGGWELEKEAVLISDPSSDTVPSWFWMLHQQSKRKLRVSLERDFGETNAAAKSVRLFVPYWVCNDASLPLAYRVVEIEPADNSETDTFFLPRAVKAAKQASDYPSKTIKRRKTSLHKVVRILEELEDLNGMPVMLSPQTHSSRTGFLPFSPRDEKNLLSQRLGISVAILRSNNYNLAISFCDLEDKERVDVKAANSHGEYYKLSAFLDMTSERTKVVHFQPHTLFVNRTGSRLLLQQHGSGQIEWIYPTDPPKVFLWQSRLGNEQLQISIDGYKWSHPFSIDREGILHIRLRREEGNQINLRAEIRNGTKDSRFLVVFRHVPVSSPYRIENRLAVLPIRFRQVGGDDDSWQFLQPGSATSFAWEDLQRERLLEVLVDGADPQKSCKYNIDEVADHQPISTESGPVTALRTTVFNEGITRVVKVADWLPSNENLAVVPVGVSISSRSSHEQTMPVVATDNQFHIIVELAEFGLSVVDHTPEELLYMSVQNLMMSYSTGLGSGISRFKLRLDELQVDNQLPFTPMPVLFRSQNGTNQLEFLLKFTVVMQGHGSLDNYEYPYLGMQGLSSSNVVFIVKIHEPIIWRLHEMFQQLNLGRLTSSQTTDVALDPIIRIGLLNTSEIRFKVSLAMSPTHRPRGVLGFWSSLMTSLGNIENMPVRIAPHVCEAICMRQSALIAAAISNIRKDLLGEPLQLLYGVDLLGNASSALEHMSKGVAALSMDKKFIQSRQKQESKGTVEDIGDVIREGGGAFAKGLLRGVTGIVTKPLEGAKSSGVEGFVQGVGKGIIGVAAQPMSGVLDLLSKTTEGANAMRMKLAAAISSEEQLLRHRLPRTINGDNILRPYDDYKAQGQVLLQLAERGSMFGQIDFFKSRGKFAFSDAYEDHFNLPEGRTAMITNRRVMLLQHSIHIGQRKLDPLKDPCTVVWDVMWDDLMSVELRIGRKDLLGSPPSLVILNLRQESRIFESKESSHVIKCHPDSQQAEEICSAILQAKNTYVSYHSMVQSQDLENKKVRKPYAAVAVARTESASGAARGLLTGMATPATIPVLTTFGAILGTAASRSMFDRDTDSLSNRDSKWGQRKDMECALAVPSSLYNKSATGKFINQLNLVWSDKRIRWNRNYHLSVWRASCPNGYISVGDIVQRSYDPPGSVVVYANKSDGKFVQPAGFELVWRSTDSGTRDPLSIWMPRAPSGYVAIGCVVVPDYYEPDTIVAYCVRADCVKNVDFEKQPLLRDRRDADLSDCSLWEVKNDAHSFIARRDHQAPPQSSAYSVLT